MNLDNFILDDWKKIPQNLRYFFLAGIFLIGVTWVVDHWGSAEPYTFWGWDMRQFGFSFGLTLIVVGFGALLLKQTLYFKNIIVYRRRYPINELNSKFFLIWFHGKLYCFDKKTKQYHHVYPWETAQDLLFAGTGNYISSKFEETETVKISNDISLKIGDYTDGGAINTRG